MQNPDLFFPGPGPGYLFKGEGIYQPVGEGIGAVAAEVFGVFDAIVLAAVRLYGRKHGGGGNNSGQAPG
jgi:hypothetical protein